MLKRWNSFNCSYRCQRYS